MTTPLNDTDQFVLSASIQRTSFFLSGCYCRNDHGTPKRASVEKAQQLALDFYRILKTKNKPQLSRWFTDVSKSGAVELQRVAIGMEADAAAICEAITSRWSNGVVEGHVNRLKMLKR